MDVTNVTVTYLAAIMPYVKYMERVAVKVRSLPLSVCLGHFRLDLAMANGMIVSNRIAVRDDSNQHDLKGFCVLSYSTLAYYKQWGMTDVCSVSRTLSPLFSDHKEYETLLWIIGNALLDPQPAAHFVILYGRGGNGKSTLLTMLRQILLGACLAVDMSAVAVGTSIRVPSSMIQLIMSNRISTLGDINFESGSINEHYVKVTTGGDTISLAPFNVRVTSTIIVGSNHLPSVGASQSLSSEAVQRRFKIIPMHMTMF